jgi:hypothetical protein
MTSIDNDTMNTVLPDSPIVSTSPVGFSAVPDGYRTPPRAVSATQPPNAPLRVRRADSLVADEDDTSPDSACNCHGTRVARVLIPSIDFHKGKGILAGDFIKPDPSATLNERQTHILTELHRWLSGRIQVHARDVWADNIGQDELVDMLDAGTWPAARLHMLVRSRTTATDDRTAPELVYHETAMWAASVCMQYLIDGVEADNSMVSMAIGFVRDDKLPDGRTIADLWDAPSVFEPLRTAAPLSLEDRIDAAVGIWEKPVAVELPVWGWVAVSVWVVLYAWIAAYLVGNPSTR